MRVPIESRALLALASALAPRDLRADWRREWDAEIWWWLGSHTGERLQLAVHCSGAVCDAAYLRMTQGDTLAVVRRIAGTPSACLAALVLLLAAVALWSGLSEARRALRDEPFQRRHLAVLSQRLPFMGAHFGVPLAKVADWDSRAQSLEGIASYSWTRDGKLAHVTPKFFGLLGTQAAAGALNSPGAVLSYDYWQKRLHGGGLGRILTIGGVQTRVIGVLPRDFWFPDLHPDVWIVAAPPGSGVSPALARLKPGVSPAAAESELRTLAAQVAPRSSGSAVKVEPIESLSVRPLTTLGIPWLVLVCATTAAAFLRFRSSPRFAAFLAAKAVLSLTLVLLITVEFHRGESNMAAGVASLWLFLAAPGAALYWCWRDQGQRCRSCLHRLAMPVSFGSGARMLLERAGTELICPQGHGTLFTADGADPEPQWDPMDSSWHELFVK